MTGRRLYDIHCDAYREDVYPWSSVTLVAWPFLPYRDQRMWNAMARRLKGVKR